QLDYLTVLAHVGCRSALPHDSSQSLTCMDFGFGADGYVDATDAEAWDWRLGLPDPHFCDLPLIPTTDTKVAAGPLTATVGTLSEPFEVYPSEGLLISGKRSIEKMQDGHYILASEGEYITSVDPPFMRANGRLIEDGAGGLYQINLAEGLVRLSDGAPVVPPGNTIVAFNEPRYNSSAEVRIGMHYEDYEWSGCPIFDAAFDSDGEHVYVAPVIIVPDGEEPYQAVAKLRLLSSGEPPYEVVQIYDDAPLPGDNQYLNNLREIEIDDSGNLYVTNTDSLNESDRLWAYDTQTGEVKKRLCLGREGSSTYIPAPTAMHLSNWGSLYLASAVQQSDADSVSINVLSPSSLALIRKITINNMGHVTAMTEDASTATIWVAGFTMSNIPEYINPLGEPFYEPYIAKVPYGATGPVQAEPLSDPVSYPDNDLALPLSIILIKSTGVDCSTANIDGTGRVDFFDFTLLAAHWLETACGQCENADITGEGNVNTKDLQFLSHCWLNSIP
ncbi:MAG: hypothetical protein JXN61_12335, partial [Sedimentisphaerales bacterium]|nr:hypothetical protein [Sedimentisphaerales bacterium]